ncbi:MAG: antibiotic biosynthesis monooxygenase [Alphaproteobacteria bacterium]|nr:antibiotic biosynthesis monooxygenase [Alphaproteobacteria bacterium]
MRFLDAVLSLAALALVAAWPLHAEENVNAPVYVVTYFDAVPGAAAQSAAITRQYAETSRKEDGNAGFGVFEEIGRPGRFAILQAWRDNKARDTHEAGANATAFREKLQPLMLSGFAVRPHSGLSVAGSHAGQPQQGLYVLTHVDVFPTFKDQAVELVKAQAEAARKDAGNSRYDVLQWDGHPNHFTLVEVWRDRNAFNTGTSAAHTKDFRHMLTPFQGALYDERLYRALR